MATTEHVLDSQSKLAYYLWLTARATEPAEIMDAAQGYLASWPTVNVANVQKIDAGWAPFDSDQRPQQLTSKLDLRCIRDAIHAHCMALREARLALPPELVELDEFFFVATEMIEHPGCHLSMTSRSALPASVSYTPPAPIYADNSANW